MTIAYFDASAFVKLLVDEEGSDVAAQVWDACDVVTSSPLAHPEVRAALAAARRAHRLDDEALEVAEQQWRGYWASVRRIGLTPAVAEAAGVLAGAHALGGADAVHLASALALGDDEVVFAVWDQRLRGGVRAAGLRLAPAGDG